MRALRPRRAVLALGCVVLVLAAGCGTECTSAPTASSHSEVSAVETEQMLNDLLDPSRSEAIRATEVSGPETDAVHLASEVVAKSPGRFHAKVLSVEQLTPGSALARLQLSVQDPKATTTPLGPATQTVGEWVAIVCQCRQPGLQLYSSSLCDILGSVGSKCAPKK